jgi:hypothetical protein
MQKFEKNRLHGQPSATRGLWKIREKSSNLMTRFETKKLPFTTSNILSKFSKCDYLMIMSNER